MSHNSVAASVRQSKEKHPELFCADPKCLWRVVKRNGKSDPCRKHPHLGPGRGR